MDTQLAFLCVLTFVVGLGVLVWGVVLLLRYHKLKKHGKRVFAAVESVTAHKRSVDVDLVWTDSDGDRREDSVSLNAGLFGTEVGKKLEIYYDNSHVMAVGKRPYIICFVMGPALIALGILLVTMSRDFIN